MNIKVVLIIFLSISLGLNFWFYHNLQFERSKFQVLFDWNKRHPEESPFVSTKDEKDFLDYIEETARTIRR